MMLMLPWLKRAKPDMAEISVVLPAPLGPSKPKKLTLFHIEAHAFERGKAVAVGFVCIIND